MVKFLLVDLLDWFDDYWLSFFNISINQPTKPTSSHNNQIFNRPLKLDTQSDNLGMAFLCYFGYDNAFLQKA